MIRTPAAGVFAFALLAVTFCAPSAEAAPPPKITGITPYGVQRGVANPIAVNGSALAGNPRLIAPFKFTVGAGQGPASDGGNWRLTVTPDAGVAIGVYPVRVQTDEGLSNPMLLAVGQLPQVAEAEDNSTLEAAQKVTAPVVVEGQAAGSDVDFYRFAGKKGQRLLVDAQCARIGSGVDPSIRLTTATRLFVASADDTPGLVTDARIVAVLPEDGDYVVEVSDTRYQGGGRPIYRLVIGEVPVAEEVYPIGGRAGETVGLELRGGSIEGTTVVATRVEPDSFLGRHVLRASGGMIGLTGPLAGMDVESLPALRVEQLPEVRESTGIFDAPVRAAVPVILNGRIDPPGDEDRFVLAVMPGQKLQIEVNAADQGSALDGVLRVLGAKDAGLATADDTTEKRPKGNANQTPPMVSPDPSLNFTVPTGLNEVTLVLKDLESRGGLGFPYQIKVTEGTQTFDLVLNDSELNLPRGGTAAVPVSVVRKGYGGPITVKAVGLPAGLTMRAGEIPAGLTQGVVTVSATPEATVSPTTLGIVAEATTPDGSLARSGAKSLVFATQGTLKTNEMTQEGIIAVTSASLAVAIEAQEGPIEVAQGYGTAVVLKATKGKDEHEALALASAAPLPAGLVVAPGSLPAKGDQASATINTTTDLALGLYAVALQAKGKVGTEERTIVAPAIRLNVVKPATVELGTAAIEVKAGGDAEIKGKVLRKGAFKEPVTVKVNGLPAGLKAEPVTVAPEATDFVVKVHADEKAAAATGSASVALAFQVNKKDYPAPTASVAVKVLPAK